jgi:hypothetical protein
VYTGLIYGLSVQAPRRLASKNRVPATECTRCTSMLVTPILISAAPSIKAPTCLFVSVSLSPYQMPFLHCHSFYVSLHISKPSFLSSSLFHFLYNFIFWSTQQRSWLRHYVRSRKVADSIPDEVIGFFNLRNSSSSTMALESTQPLTEMSTWNLPGGKGRPALMTDIVTAICDPIA